MDIESQNASDASSKRIEKSSRRVWTQLEEKALLDKMKGLVAQGWRSEGGCRPGFMTQLEQHIIGMFPSIDIRTRPHIESKIQLWKRQHVELFSMIGKSGTAWNPDTKMLEVTDEVWDAYGKVDKHLKGLQRCPISLYPNWCEVFGRDRATREHARDFESILTEVNLDTRNEDNLNAQMKQVHEALSELLELCEWDLVRVGQRLAHSEQDLEYFFSLPTFARLVFDKTLTMYGRTKTLNVGILDYVLMLENLQMGLWSKESDGSCSNAQILIPGKNKIYPDPKKADGLLEEVSLIGRSGLDTENLLVTSHGDNNGIDTEHDPCVHNAKKLKCDATSSNQAMGQTSVTKIGKMNEANVVGLQPDHLQSSHNNNKVPHGMYKDGSRSNLRLFPAKDDGKNRAEKGISAGGTYSVLNQKRGHVFKELQRPGTPHYNIKAYLPVIETFGFSSTLRAATSRQAFPQCVFDQWDMMSSDPLEAGSQAATLVSDIRKRKGLKEQMTPLSECEDKL
ncbi:unnamed protein product [Thlaspi arvense]|uniref:Myb/SANT-like domain-containing protein n=1 Tax=Thlaspi arvense TaxID=13288 RepID=A0AAU9T7I9_THLAR|nr:unnamed protein product [Thlaspi arvense]